MNKALIFLKYRIDWAQMLPPLIFLFIFIMLVVALFPTFDGIWGISFTAITVVGLLLFIVLMSNSIKKSCIKIVDTKGNFIKYQ